MNASFLEIKQTEKIGDNTATFIKFICDLCNEYNNFSSNFFQLSTVELEKQYFEYHFNFLESESLILVCIDNNFNVKDRLILNRKCFIKNEDESKKIIEFIIKSKCKRVVIGIYHPNNFAFVNKSDMKLIKRLRKYILPLQVKIFDCIICSQTNIISVKFETAFEL